LRRTLVTAGRPTKSPYRSDSDRSTRVAGTAPHVPKATLTWRSRTAELGGKQSFVRARSDDEEAPKAVDPRDRERSRRTNWRKAPSFWILWWICPIRA